MYKLLVLSLLMHWPLPWLPDTRMRSEVRQLESRKGVSS
jgi:hypothetical protein